MENSKLFQVCEQGYNCTQVDEYIAAVKSEYKKLYEYSKKLDSAVKEQREKSAAVVEENEKLTQQSAEREKKILELETALSKAKNSAEKTAPSGEEMKPFSKAFQQCRCSARRLCVKTGSCAQSLKP